VAPRPRSGGRHRGAATALAAKGSVRLIGESIDAKVFEALSTIAGGEAPPPVGWSR
jgi:hypothetical protein